MALSDWYTKFDDRLLHDRLLHDRLLHDLMAYRPYRTAIEISATTSTKEKPAMKPIDWSKPLEKAHGERIGQKAEVIHVDNDGERYVKYVTDKGNWGGCDKVDAQGRSLVDGKQLVRNKLTKYTRFVLVLDGRADDRKLCDKRIGHSTREAAETYRDSLHLKNPWRQATIVEMTWEE